MLLGILKTSPWFVEHELLAEGEAMLRESQQLVEFTDQWWGWGAKRVTSKPSVPLTDLLEKDPAEKATPSAA